MERKKGGTWRYIPEKIINKFGEAEILLSQGISIVEATRKFGIIEQTYYRWRKECGGISANRIMYPLKRVDWNPNGDWRLKIDHDKIWEISIKRTIRDECPCRGVGTNFTRHW